MSGPVWKRLRLKGTCDSCGETVPEVLAVGTVVDFRFLPDFRFCPACYDHYRGRYEDLDPKAVSEQRNPPLLSRPSDKSDLPE